MNEVPDIYQERQQPNISCNCLNWQSFLRVQELHETVQLLMGLLLIRQFVNEAPDRPAVEP